MSSPYDPEFGEQYYRDLNFTRGKELVRGFYERIANKNSQDLSYWKRILDLEGKCNNLRVVLQFPPIIEQIPTAVVKSVTSNGVDFYASSTDTMTKKQLTPEQEQTVRIHRCNALAVHTFSECLIPGMSGHHELLFLLELKKDDAAALVQKIVENDNGQTVIAQIPAYWNNLLQGMGFVQQPTTTANALPQWIRASVGGAVKKGTVGNNPTSDEFKYGDQPSDPVPAAPKEAIVDEAYSKDDKIAQNQLLVDYQTVAEFPKESLDGDNIERLKNTHTQMFNFVTTRSSTLANWQLLISTEDHLRMFQVQPSLSTKDWYMSVVKDPTLQLAQRSKIRMYEMARRSVQWTAIQSAEDIKALGEIQTLGEASSLHGAMVALRSEWKNKYLALEQKQVPLSQKLVTNPQDSAAMAQAQEIQKQIADLSKKAKETEAAFRAKIMIAKSRTKTNGAKYAEWIKESQEMDASAPGWPMLGTSEGVMTRSAGGSGVVAVKEPTPMPTRPQPSEMANLLAEFRKEYKKQADELAKRERKPKLEMYQKLTESFANAQKTHEQINASIEKITAAGMRDKYQEHMFQARECYHFAMKAAIESGITDNITEDEVKDALTNLDAEPTSTELKNYLKKHTNKELESLQKILKQSNDCLDSYFAVFKAIEPELPKLEEMEKGRKARETLVKIRRTLSQAQTAITEAKTFLRGRADIFLKETYEEQVKGLEAQLQAMKSTVDLAATTNASNPDEMDKLCANIDTQARSIIAASLDIQDKGDELAQKSLMLRQLEGSELNLKDAERAARESAALAKQHLKRLELAKQAQARIVQRTSFELNPTRTVRISRGALEKTEQATIAKHKRNLKVLQNALERAVNFRNVSMTEKALMKLENYETMVDQTALATELAASTVVKEQAHVLLSSPTVMKKEPRSVVVKKEILSDEAQNLQDAIEDLRNAVESEDLDRLEELIANVEDAEDEVGGEFHAEAARWKAEAQRLLD